MGWYLRELSDGTWEWEVFQSAFGSGLGQADTLVTALVRLTIVEAEILEDPLDAESISEMEANPEAYLAASRPLVRDAIGTNVLPLDPEALRAQLT